MKLGEKYKCKYRGIVTVTNIFDENSFEVTNGKNFYTQSKNDIGKILTLLSESDTPVNTPFLKYDSSLQSNILNKLALNNDSSIINKEIKQLYELHKELNLDGTELNKKILVIQNEKKGGPRRTKDDFEVYHEAQKSYESSKLKLNNLINIHNEPYFARIDLKYQDNHQLRCYIGKTSYSSDKFMIYDWRNNVNKMYYLSSQTQFQTSDGLAKVIGRFEYSVNSCILHDFQVKSKQIGIIDGNSKNKSEVIISDKFLLDVLNDKRRSSELRDIIPTIQEDQYKIISQTSDFSFIVQGCAGSGKTMILLHRLSYLIYNKLISKDKVLILSPNSQFISFINKLMNELEIGSIQIDTFNKFINDIAKQYYPNNEVAFNPLNCNLGNLDAVNLLEKYSKFIKAEIDIFINSRIEDKVIYTINKYNKTQISKKSSDSWYKFYLSCKNNIKDILTLDEKNKDELIKAGNKLILVTEQKMVNCKNTIDSLMDKISHKEQELLDLERSEKENIKNETKKSRNNLFKRLLNLFTTSSEEKIKYESIIKSLNEEIEKLKSEVVTQEMNVSGHSAYINKIQVYISLLEKRSFTATEKADIINDLDTTNKNLNISKFVLTKSERDYLEKKKEIFEAKLIGTEVAEKFLNMHHVECNEDTNLSSYLALIFEAMYKGPVCNFKAYFIDEAQDYGPIELFILKHITHSKNTFNLFGDIYQRLNGKQNDSWDEFKKVIDGEYFELNANYRNTYQITSFYNKLLGKKDLPIGIHGKEVKTFSNASEAIDIIIRSNRHRKVIILNNTEDIFKYDEITQHKGRLNYVFENKDQFDYQRVNITTVDKVKGMEFDIAVVILDGMTLNSKYVAMTRAIHELIIIESTFFINRKDNCEEIEHLLDYHKYWSDKENRIRNNKFDANSSLILDVKNKKQTAIEYFYEQLNIELKENIVIAVVPSHDPLNIDSGIHTLGKRLATANRIDATDCLVRAYKVEKQAKGGNRSKEVHLKSIKLVNSNKIKNNNILLLDDVTTTGSSLEACKEILIKNGAQKVQCLALSKTIKEL